MNVPMLKKTELGNYKTDKRNPALHRNVTRAEAREAERVFTKCVGKVIMHGFAINPSMPYFMKDIMEVRDPVISGLSSIIDMKLEDYGKKYQNFMQALIDVTLPWQFVIVVDCGETAKTYEYTVERTSMSDLRSNVIEAVRRTRALDGYTDETNMFYFAMPMDSYVKSFKPNIEAYVNAVNFPKPIETTAVEA